MTLEAPRVVTKETPVVNNTPTDALEPTAVVFTSEPPDASNFSSHQSDEKKRDGWGLGAASTFGGMG